MAYKTVKKLLAAYESGDLSSRKNKLQLKNGTVSLDTEDDGSVFEMDTLDFIQQVAKLGELGKLPIEQATTPDDEE